jgi:D-alanine-D-alanine ligase
MRYDLVHRENDDEVRRSEELAITAYRFLGCRDAGRVDVRSDAAGRPNFIEVNPLPGLNEIDSDLPILCRKSGISYVQLIERIVNSAKQRIK